MFIDAVHFSVRDNGQIKKLAAYVILAVSLTGHKEVLSIHIGENESAKYWLGVLNELKNRGVKDILVICADGLSRMKEAAAAYPQTELQRCIVHQMRNTLKYAGEKIRRNLQMTLRPYIRHRPKKQHWSVFPSDTALLKALYTATTEISKKWTILISLRCAPLHQDILHRGLTNGSIQFILKKERERPISRSHHKVIFLRLIVFTEFFRRAKKLLAVIPGEQPPCGL